MVKSPFDAPLTTHEIDAAEPIILEAKAHNVSTIINVGTSVIESKNCIALAQRYENCYAAIGIHPNDLTSMWKNDIEELKKLLQKKEDYKIIAIGECGLDKHYPDYDEQRQRDAFKIQIELALEHGLALIVHTRDADDEVLPIIAEYRGQGLKGVIHCFSEGLAFAQKAIELGFVLGIGGTITYPKNQVLREVVKTVGLEHIILETDAPFLPPQEFRGKQNHPKYIALIAEYIAKLVTIDVEIVAEQTTKNALRIFNVRSTL